MLNKKTVRIISEALSIPVGNIHEGLSVENCEKWDSLSHVRLVLAIENEIGRPLTVAEIIGLSSATDVQKIVS